MIYFLTNQREIEIESNSDIVLSDKQTAWDFINSLDEIAVDTETTGFDPYSCEMLSAQLGNEVHQVVLDLSDTHNHYFLKQVIEHNKDKVFLFQNAKFDLRFLMAKGIFIDRVYDTFLAEQVLYNGIKDHRKGLDALAMRYLNESLDKSIRGDIHKHGLTYEVIKYAADDVRVLPGIKAKQRERALEKELGKAISLENLFVVALAYTEMCGIKINLEDWEKKCKEDDAVMHSYISKLDEWILSRKDEYPEYIENQLDLFSDELRTKINWNSQKQLIPIFKNLGLNLEVKDKVTGKLKDSIEDSVIRTQKDKSDLVKIYLDYTKSSKVVSTYGRNFINNVSEVTGRVHTSFKQILKTGRISSSPNIQNIPAVPEDSERTKELYERECFTPEEGNVFIDSDYSSQESVILANFSMEPKLIEFYNSGASDLHSFVAKALYPQEIGDTPTEDIKKKFKTLRQNAKAANFALAYGGTGDTIAKNLGVSKDVGSSVEKAFFDAFPALKNYFDNRKAESLSKGYILVSKVSGRKVFINEFDEFIQLTNEVDRKEFWDYYREQKNNNGPHFEDLKLKVSKFFKTKGSIERESMNFPIQGCAGEQTKLATAMLYKVIKDRGLLFTVKIVNLIHDEILLECPKDMAEEFADILKKCMEDAGAVYCKTVKLHATPMISNQWIH